LACKYQRKYKRKYKRLGHRTRTVGNVRPKQVPANKGETRGRRLPLRRTMNKAGADRKQPNNEGISADNNRVWNFGSRERRARGARPRARPRRCRVLPGGKPAGGLRAPV